LDRDLVNSLYEWLKLCLPAYKRPAYEDTEIIYLLHSDDLYPVAEYLAEALQRTPALKRAQRVK